MTQTKTTDFFNNVAIWIKGYVLIDDVSLTANWDCAAVGKTSSAYTQTAARKRLPEDTEVGSRISDGIRLDPGIARINN